MGVLAGNRKLSVLKYADDLVLCSVTSDGLQLGMNALHKFCVSNNLTVNTSNSKAMYFSGTSYILQPGAIRLGRGL